MQRTVLISGASRGIGRAVAEQLLARGHRLCLGLRNPAQLKGTLLDSESVLPVAYDAGHPEQAVDLVDAARRWAGTTIAANSCPTIPAPR